MIYWEMRNKVYGDKTGRGKGVCKLTSGFDFIVEQRWNGIGGVWMKDIPLGSSPGAGQRLQIPPFKTRVNYDLSQVRNMV